MISRCRVEQLGPPLYADIVESRRHARLQRLRADATRTPYETADETTAAEQRLRVQSPANSDSNSNSNSNSNSDSDSDSDSDSAATAPLNTRTTLLCTAETESLEWTIEAIYGRIDDVATELRRGNLRSAQIAYDTVIWASDDLSISLDYIMQRCRDATPDLAASAQTAVTWAQLASRAYQRKCHQEFAPLGLDCN